MRKVRLCAQPVMPRNLIPKCEFYTRRKQSHKSILNETRQSFELN